MAIAEARQKAKKAGVPMADLRGLTTEAEIQAVIDRHTGKSRPVAKKKTATVAKKSTARKAPARKTTATRKAATSTRTTTKSNSRTTTKPKTTARKTTAAKTTKRAANSNGNGGRNLLEDIDWTETEGWNPREGSAPDLILRALRKFKGNREKVFDALVADLWTFVKKTDSNGRKRSKAEAEWQLRYRISRTAWDFAKRTGQHEPSSNRATYGEGGTGIGVSGGMPVQFRPDNFTGKPVFKRAKAKTTKTAAKTTTRKAAGRPRTAAKTTAKPKATTTAKARTTAAKRSTGTTARRRPTVRRK